MDVVAVGKNMTVDLNLGFIKYELEKMQEANAATRIVMSKGLRHLNTVTKMLVDSK